MQRLADYDFQIPGALIAQSPALKRSESRLLVMDEQKLIHDQHFYQLPQWLRAGDLVVLNHTAVLKARLRAQKPSGGAVEVLIERLIAPCEALALVGSNKKLRIGQVLHILTSTADIACSARIKARCEALFVVEFDMDALSVMDAYGSIPLPPYIAKQADGNDEERYQTIYARDWGSVAAPTAGLHFDQPLFDVLGQLGIAITSLSLHVGMGTFLPVREAEIEKHRMHPEVFNLSEHCARAVADARQRGGRVFAVGTTTLRTLETCADPGQPGLVIAQKGETRLFVRPGFRFTVCDALITNFHLPKSTLMMLVSAFAGFESVRRCYAHAVAHQYRFFSYGDACLFFRERSCLSSM